MTSSDAAVRSKLTALAEALRHYHSALLDVAKSEHEFLNGPVKSPYELYNLVTGGPSFQWLRPVSGLMATLDEVLDAKDRTLRDSDVTDVKNALGLLFADSDPTFAEFRQGYARAKDDARVRETEARWREILNSVEA